MDRCEATRSSKAEDDALTGGKLWNAAVPPSAASVLRSAINGAGVIILWISEPPPDESPPPLTFLLSPAERPPPEPPPSPRRKPLPGNRCKASMGSPRSHYPPVALAEIRPPPKPNWDDSLSAWLVVCVLFWFFCCVYEVFVKMSGTDLFCVSGSHGLFRLVLVWIIVVSLVLDEMSLKILAFWNKFCLGLLVTIINLIILFNQQVTPAFVFKLDRFETTNSRSEPATAKDMIRNWIDLKTVDSPFSLAFNPRWKIFVWVLGLYVWLGFGLLFPVHHLCNAANYLVGWTYFLLAKLESVWWEDLVCVVSLLADSKFGIYTTFQWMSDLWFKMNGTKATYGRFEPVLVKKMIRNWIDIKTVAPLVMNQADMKWMCWLLVYETWIDVDLYSTFSMFFHWIGWDQLLELATVSGWGLSLHSFLVLIVIFWFFNE